MRGDTPRGLTRAGTLAALGLGLLLLPWRPTIAQDAPKGEDAKPPAEAPKEPTAEVLKGSVLEQELKRAEDRLKWSEEMLKKKYVSQSQVEADRAMLLKARERIESLRQEDDDPFAAAREQVKVAQLKEKWLEQMQKQGLASADALTAAHAEVLERKARLSALEAQSRKDVEIHKFAIQDAQDAVETANGNLRTHGARVAKAEAQRQGASAVLARSTQLTASGAVTVSELAKAKADMAVADAVVNEAMAEQNQAAIERDQVTRRLASLVNQANPGAVTTTDRATTKRNMKTAAALTLKAVAEHQLAKTAPVEELARPIPRDANARIDELEAKLDRVLKELEAMRKEAPAKPAPDGFNVTMDQYRQLNTELSKLHIERYKAEVTVKYLEDESNKFRNSDAAASGAKTEEQINKAIEDEFSAHPEAISRENRREEMAKKAKAAKDRIANVKDPNRVRAERDLADAEQAYKDLWETMYPKLRRQVLETAAGGKVDEAALKREQALSAATLDLKKLKLHEKLLEEQIKDASIEVRKAQDEAKPASPSRR